MSAVQDAINKWGIAKLRKELETQRKYREIYGFPIRAVIEISDDAQITLDEQIPDPYFCETCGPDPYTITLSDDAGNIVQLYMTLGDVLKEMME